MVQQTGFTLSSTPSSVHLLSVKKSGQKLSPVVDFTLAGSTITLQLRMLLVRKLLQN